MRYLPIAIENLGTFDIPLPSWPASGGYFKLRLEILIAISLIVPSPYKPAPTTVINFNFQCTFIRSNFPTALSHSFEPYFCSGLAAKPVIIFEPSECHSKDRLSTTRYFPFETSNFLPNTCSKRSFGIKIKYYFCVIFRILFSVPWSLFSLHATLDA